MKTEAKSEQEYYSLCPDCSVQTDTILSAGHLRFSKGDRHPADIFPENRLFLEHGGRSLKYYQLVYITSGGGWFRNSNVSHDVKAGTMFIIRPGVWHSYAPDTETGWESYFVEFSGPILSDLAENLIPGIDKDFLYVGINQEIAGIYRRMLDLSAAGGPQLQMALRAYVSLLVTIVARIANPKDDDGQSDRAKINAAINYMEKNISEPIDIPDIAARFNFSYSQFRRVFKAMTGVSPMDFLKNIRIQKSKHLLLTTNLLVKQIAMMCGFSSGEYFCNSFARDVGMTPSEYREKKGAGEVPSV